MALNFIVSYTFSPNTTIASAQVNTNFSDIAGVFQGLEAETKTLAKLKMDADPTIALEVATKQYVDHYSTWRRPNLRFGSVTTVSVESGLDGISGDIPILFPDGTVRTETSTTRTTFDITRNAVLVTSGAQSGLTGATSEATNTWYALYAVKVTDSSTLWVTVGSTVLPVQGSFSTLNTAYGANGWVYLGLIRNGDNSSSTGDILDFYQSGNLTLFKNTLLGVQISGVGTLLGTAAPGTSISYTYSAGTGTTGIPSNISMALYQGSANTNPGQFSLVERNGARYRYRITCAVKVIATVWMPAVEGVSLETGNSVNEDVALAGFMDGVLGVGSNPII